MIRRVSCRFGTVGLGLAMLCPALIGGWGSLIAAEPARPAVDYVREVKPLLTKRCYACHGALKQNAGLRLDTAALMRKGGDGGPALEPGKSAESLLADAVSGRDGWKMPPEGEGSSLSAEEVATLRAWIDQGAKAPADERPMADPRKHWSFQPPARPRVPIMTGERRRWVRNPVDAFLAEQHQPRGLTPRPPAEPGELIRRVFLDLVGLVPTPDEVRAFIADHSDLAYEELVDRLLASPQYGERWGRHWMDVWRYSDWDGYGAEVRESQPHIWRWRDWIVESLNADAGYDRMVEQMLAADEATPADPKALRATGYLARNWYKFNRNVWLDATVEHTAKAFLGLTLNCARCHDHKYDPIPQTDYYAFRAFFEPHTTRTDRLPGQPDTQKDGLVRVYDSEPDAKTFLFTRGDEKRPAQDRPLSPRIPRVLEKQVALPPIQSVPLPLQAQYPGLSSFVRQECRNEVRAKLAASETARSKMQSMPATSKSALQVVEKELEAARADMVSLEARIAADDARFASPPRAEAGDLARKASKAERSAALHRAELAMLVAERKLVEKEAAAKPGDAKAKQAEAEAKTKRNQARTDLKARQQALRQDTKAYSTLTPVYPAASTGRRLALAHWIVDRKNPLAARVAINHMWMRHYGTPLVSSEFDFGVNGKLPSHPALLDWLAVELMESGWRMKPLHRLMVTSSAYRMESRGSGPGDPNLVIDPANRDYWRMNPRRMEAEAVRDNVLLVAGNLDPTLGGPDLDPETGLVSPRRSLYFRHAKEKRVTFLRLFDSSNVQSCYRRSESIVPQQALALANSPLSFAQARLLAGKLAKEVEAGASPAHQELFVAAAFERVLGRLPSAEEISECVRYLSESATRQADRSSLTPFPEGPKPAVAPSANPAQRAREGLVHVLLNHNDFVTIR